MIVMSFTRDLIVNTCTKQIPTEIVRYVGDTGLKGSRYSSPSLSHSSFSFAFHYKIVQQVYESSFHPFLVQST